MSKTQEELLAATIRKQIAYLEGVLTELENQPLPEKDFSKHIQLVEARLRELRGQMQSV